jgi:23S rRNA pseudouridine1911/1915/1917 synthase
MPETFTIDKFDTGTRLDLFLVGQLDLSRSKVQNRIKNGDVTINNKVIIAPHTFLKKEDIITLNEPVAKPYDPIRKGKKATKKKIEFELDIIFENDDVLVVNKQAGVLTHPTENSDEKTLMDAAVAHSPEIATVGDNPKSRAGIVHRLDRDASGVLIIAKTQEAFEHLKAQFKNRTVNKIYRALVHGQVVKDEKTIKGHIARSKNDGKMVARPPSQKGKEAITHYDVIQRYANASELKVRIETGRTHQIRVQMLSLGHPVVGDNIYIIKNLKRIPFKRLGLHAEHLTITLPGETDPQTFTAPLPADMKNLIAKLHKV